MSKNFLKDKHFKVLIVEDEPILAMAMELKLKKMGLDVSGIATTPDNAMVHVQNHYPDMALIDINLNASKTGIDVANYIWKNFQIPIIFLTSYYNDNILKQAMEAEPYAYLLKPCRFEELKVTINTTLHKHQFFFKNRKLFEPLQQEFISLTQNIKYNRIEQQLYVNNTLFKLTKNEKKLFEILTQRPGSVMSFDSIFNFIWREDVYDLAKLRSLIYRLKTRLNVNLFENLYEEGYKIKCLKNDYEAV
jgi:DNA-binding response OmpR family regulator